MQIKVTGVQSVSAGLNRDLQRFVERLATDIQAAAKANTPVKTGNARRNWQKDTRQPGITVNNRVPYIERLEAGASKQAPRGIIGPTLQQIKGKYK